MTYEKKSRKEKVQDAYKGITDSILESLKKGVAPWLQPWEDGGLSLPVNHSTNRAYNGVNILSLWLQGKKKGYPVNRWLTFKQARDLGGFVKKGEKGTVILFVGTFSKEEENSKGEKEETFFNFLKTHHVFNVEQTTLELPKVEKREIKTRDEIDAEIKNIKAKIKTGGDRAYFSPSEDFIRLPEPSQFKTVDDYYSTIFHELTHWSGHSLRLDRLDKNAQFGKPSYAFEELVAELGSAFLCAHYGIKGKLQHENYIGHWITKLSGDVSFIAKAASKASEAANYLIEKAEGKKAKEKSA